MSKSTNSKSHKERVSKFKENAKAQNAVAPVEKTHLIPNTAWETTDKLELGGDLLEALESNLVETYQAIQDINDKFANVGRVVQAIMQRNIQAEKIRIEYMWNNGEEATEADIAKFKEDMANINKIAAEKIAKMQDKVVSDKNASESGLVNTDGLPIGSTVNQENEEEHAISEDDSSIGHS